MLKDAVELLETLDASANSRMPCIAQAAAKVRELAEEIERLKEELCSWHEGDNECCKLRHEAQIAREEALAEVERLKLKYAVSQGALEGMGQRAEKAEAELAEANVRRAETVAVCEQLIVEIAIARDGLKATADHRAREKRGLPKHRPSLPPSGSSARGWRRRCGETNKSPSPLPRLKL